MFCTSSVSGFRYCVIIPRPPDDSNPAAWCMETFGNKREIWKQVGNCNFYFLNKDDAVLFELTWG